MQKSSFPIKWLAIFLSVLALLGGVAIYLQTYWGPPAVGGDFELKRAHGTQPGKPPSIQTFRLSSLKGHPVVLYFGYIQCPDICPLSLHRLSQAFNKLEPQTREKIIPVLVSVDHRGDTAEKTQQYIEAFFPKGVGLVGDKAQIDRVTLQYRAGYIIEEAPKSAMGYTVAHNTSFFLVDADGRYKQSIPAEGPIEDLVVALQQLVASGGAN